MKLFMKFPLFPSSIEYNDQCVPSDKPMGIPGEPIEKDLTIRYTYAVTWVVG